MAWSPKIVSVVLIVSMFFSGVLLMNFKIPSILRRKSLTVNLTSEEQIISPPRNFVYFLNTYTHNFWRFTLNVYSLGFIVTVIVLSVLLFLSSSEELPTCAHRLQSLLNEESAQHDYYDSCLAGSYRNTVSEPDFWVTRTGKFTDVAYFERSRNGSYFVVYNVIRDSTISTVFVTFSPDGKLTGITQ